MHCHQLLDHPLFEERPIKDVLEPFGFEMSIETVEPPIDPAFDEAEDADAYANDPDAYIDSLKFTHRVGFTEILRSESEDDIFSIAVGAKTVFAQLLLCADSTFAGPSSPYSSCYVDVYHERMRQLSTEDFSRERDDGYTKGELSRAALAYTNMAQVEERFGLTDNADLSVYRLPDWPWSKEWWKPSRDSRRNLVKAGALILAEIERLDRTALREVVA